MVEGPKLNLSYNPLSIKKIDQDDEDEFNRLYNPMKASQTKSEKIKSGKTSRSRQIEEEMRKQRMEHEHKMRKMEDSLPTFQKHLPRKLHGMIQNLDTSIKQRISKAIIQNRRLC